MALTPEDVVNKRFQSTKFREGYDQDEVDDFLDEVVVELRRLNQENEELRQRLTSIEAQGGSAPAAAAPAPVFTQPEPAAAAPTWGQPAEQQAPTWGQPAQPVAEPVVAPVPVAAPVTDPNDANSTNNLLQLARRLHEEHVREGVEKRDALIAEGHATAARIVADAEQAQRAQVAALEADRARLEAERTSIETDIDELRTFEREYRSKLKSYIEGQLRELEEAAPESPAAAAVAAPVVAETVVESVSEAPVIEPAPAAAPSGFFDQPSTPPAQQQPPVNFTGFGTN